jgi:hypothetical protein
MRFLVLDFSAIPLQDQGLAVRFQGTVSPTIGARMLWNPPDVIRTPQQLAARQFSSDQIPDFGRQQFQADEGPGLRQSPLLLHGHLRHEPINPLTQLVIHDLPPEKTP